LGPKREEVEGGWRILHNEELHNLYACTEIKSRWAGLVARMRGMKNAHEILIVEPEGKQPLE
jgi:hypothetical protein